MPDRARSFGAHLPGDLQRMQGGFGRIGLTTIPVVALGATIVVSPQPLLVWNASASVPVGLYELMPAAPLQRGDLVVVRLPSGLRSLAATRGYVPAGVPVIKRIGAVAGDRVCARGHRLLVNGRLAAIGLARDHRGRKMPWWNGCGPLAHGAILLLGEDRQSFDSRYFGPVTRSHLIGKARLLWRR